MTMWKDTLKIGFDLIDKQHEVIFKKVEEFVNDIQYKDEDHKQEIIATILYLKQYTVDHFNDEENYMESINDADLPRHKKLHKDFIKTILKHEKKLLESDFAQKEINVFAGTLLAWLVYHVADADQKIGKEMEAETETSGYTELIYDCVCKVVSGLLGTDKKAMSKTIDHNEGFGNSIVAKVVFSQGLTGYINFVFAYSFIKELVKSLIQSKPEEFDDFVVSLMSQVATIIGDHICERLKTDENIEIEMETVISERLEVHEGERFALDTGSGIIGVDIAIS